MKVVLAVPNFPQPRGNTVTVKRIADRLKSIGIDTDIISTTEEKTINPPEDADLIHGFHAYRFYEYSKRTEEKIEPFLLSITGTDLNHDFYNPDRRTQMIETLNNAKAVHVFTKEAKVTLIGECPQFENKVFVIPQGTSSFPKTETRIDKEENTFVFLLPAGIRKVKNIPGAIEMLQLLHQKFPHIRVWIAGPILEEEEGTIVKQLVDEYKDWLSYFGEVSFPEMGSLYRQADVLINSSFSEGQASAILEAMDHSLPVIVFGNQGNKSIVEHGKTGFIYEETDQFLDYAEQIMNNNELRQRIGKQAAQYIAECHSGEKEAVAFQRLYQHILSNLRIEELQEEDLGL